MSYRELGRTSSQRKAMLRDLTTDLLINERIMTTEAYTREVRSTAGKMITLGKCGNLHIRRQATASVRNEVASVHEENENIVVESASQKLFNDIAPRHAERQGGYARTLKTEPRCGDDVPMTALELVQNHTNNTTLQMILLECYDVGRYFSESSSALLLKRISLGE